MGLHECDNSHFSYDLVSVDLMSSGKVKCGECEVKLDVLVFRGH